MTNSNSYWELLKKFSPNGTQTNSKRPSVYVEGVYPKVLERGNGGIVYDVDGNRYIDLMSGLGAISLGYANQTVNDSVIMQLMKGVSFSLPTVQEYLVAKKLVDLVPSTEMWKFTKTGSDACSMAVKCARAYTNRTKVLSCGYHGWHDWYSIVNDKKAGIPAALSLDIDKAKYNDLSSFHKILDGCYACVIMEPMVFDSPKKGFLETIREWCDISNTLLIFDEVVTGGRFHKFVAQNIFGVFPDLTILSKGIANGFPLAAVGGPSKIMKTFERDDFFVSTTFGGEVISLVACLSTLDILTKSISSMYFKGLRIKEHFNKLFFHTTAVCKGYPTRLTFDFPTNEHKALFMQEICKNGVLVGYSNFVMMGHADRDVDDICEAIEKSSRIVLGHWDTPAEVLEGRLPVEPLRMR